MAMPKQSDPQFKLRLPVNLHGYLEAAAYSKNRSMNSEIVFRLEQSSVQRGEIETLRDRFAMAALGSMIAAVNSGQQQGDFDAVAVMAYGYADAMIAARQWGVEPTSTPRHP